MDQRFSGDLATLSSAASQLGDILARVTDAAAHFDAEQVDDAANDLYEVERSLNAAVRRIETLLRRLG